MAKNQKSYTPEFNQQIVDLYNAGGTSYPQLERPTERTSPPSAYQCRQGKRSACRL